MTCRTSIFQHSRKVSREANLQGVRKHSYLEYILMSSFLQLMLFCSLVNKYCTDCLIKFFFLFFALNAEGLSYTKGRSRSREDIEGLGQGRLYEKGGKQLVLIMVVVTIIIVIIEIMIMLTISMIMTKRRETKRVKAMIMTIIMRKLLIMILII